MSQSPAHYLPQFVAEGVDGSALRVRGFQIDEEVARGSTCRVELAFDGGTVEPRALLRKQAALVVGDETAELRRFTGTVTHAAERATTAEGRQELRVTIESPLALLRHSSDYKIFQDKTTQDVIEEVLKTCGLEPSMWVFRLSGAPHQRKVCTQYGETMLSFVQRLLEEDGLFWFTEHATDGAKVVFADAPSGWSPIPGDAEVLFREVEGLVAAEAVSAISERRRIRPKKVTLRDHDFERPTLDLEETSELDTALGREHYEYPGRYFDPDRGSQRAEIVRAALEGAARGFELRGHVIRLTAGHQFELHDTDQAALDGKYVVARAVHRWSEPTPLGEQGFSTDALVWPADLRVCPEPLTPRPRALGDLAMVTVPPGEEIHTDKHGRIKVQYHWDRHGQIDDKSSGWTRQGQMHTSGSVVIPRQSWEMFIEAEDGDPDRPIALGRLYNPASPPTDSLPGGKTNSSLKSYSTPAGGGHNEIRMNDGGGGELVDVHAQKDLNLVVANNKDEKVTNGAEVGVTANQSVKVGANHTAKISAKDKVTVGGSQKHTVSASRTKTISGDENHTVSGSRSVTIGASHTTLTPMSDSVSTSGSLSETVSGMCLEVAALGVSLAVAGSTSITVGGAKIEAVASGKADITVGARASTVGGAFVNVTPKDVTFNTSGAKVTTVGGAWLGNAGANAELSTSANLSITVGGAVAMNAATIVLKVGGSVITLSGGSVDIKADEVTLNASGPAAELAGMVKSK